MSNDGGVDARGVPSGSHTLVVGATGSGKTVSQAWIAVRLIEEGHGAVVIDPKGDRMLRDELTRRRTRDASSSSGPRGPGGLQPLRHGTDTEIADKALSGERSPNRTTCARPSATSETPSA